MSTLTTPVASLPSAALSWAARPFARALSIGIIGPGHVGTALLAQLRAAQPRLRRRQHLDIQLRLVTDSRHLWLDSDDSELESRRDAAQIWHPADLDGVAGCLVGTAPAVLVDCTASETVVAYYSQWLRAGIHIVTPNKLAMSGDAKRWHAIRAAAAEGGAELRYETTVGAGLPVVRTLRDLIDTGDDLRSVEGVFSGTMAWLLHSYNGAQPFSALVREAVERGYAEPDPRSDLCGRDVARKLVILAREAGMALSLDDVAVESLVPASLANVESATFMDQLPQLDADMARRLAAARRRGRVLRHVGRLDPRGHACVGLEAVPADHPFAHACLTDNMIVFHTRRYDPNPLLVQGPGAGAEVTAAGVFADILDVAAHGVNA